MQFLICSTKMVNLKESYKCTYSALYTIVYQIKRMQSIRATAYS